MQACMHVGIGGQREGGWREKRLGEGKGGGREREPERFSVYPRGCACSEPFAILCLRALRRACAAFASVQRRHTCRARARCKVDEHALPRAYMPTDAHLNHPVQPGLDFLLKSDSSFLGLAFKSRSKWTFHPSSTPLSGW